MTNKFRSFQITYSAAIYNFWEMHKLLNLN